jgi:FAD/FMN-containing dehydrogenase
VRQRVRPTDPAWPSAASWNRLKDEVAGNLIPVQPLFAACQAQPESDSCAQAVKYAKNPYWISDQPAGTEVSGWLDAWTPATSAYAIKAHDAADVSAGVNFAREHNLRLVIKGGGHSYMGHSNAPDSLLIWTRAMNAVTLHDAFMPQGCEEHATPVPAVSAGAGAVWMDLYTEVTTQGGRYVQGGGCTSVGVAGLLQGGGYGSFSRGFGTAAASLLEAEVVTADGRIRVVNECRDPELFWALRGGGGGTFAVMTRLTLKTHELPKRFGGVGTKIKAQSDTAFRTLMSRLLAHYRDRLFNEHWGEQISFFPDNTVEISMNAQGLEQTEIDTAWAPFLEWLHSAPDTALQGPFNSGVGELPRNLWDVESNRGMIRDQRDDAIPNRGWWQGDQGQAGAFLHGYESLWLPAALLEPRALPRLVDALFAASRFKRVQLHLNKALARARPEARVATLRTSTNPVVVDAFALAIIADGRELPAYAGYPAPAIDLAAARADARAIDSAAAELRRIAPRSGTYLAESNYFNRAWREDYWGANYRRLRTIKRKYDPDGLFFVRHGVGSEDWSADGFTRLL